GSKRDFFAAVILQGAGKFRLHAAAQPLGRNNGRGSTKTEDPSSQFELATDVHLHRNAAAANLTDLLRMMSHARAHLFGDVGIEYDLQVERLFLDNTECRFEITLDRKIFRLVEGFTRLFDSLDPFDGKCPDLLVLLNEGEKIQASAKIHQ